MNKYLNHHNSNIEYIRKNPYKSEQFKIELDSKDYHSDIIWGGGFESAVSILIEKGDNDINTLFHYLRNNVLIELQSFNFYLGANYWFITEDKSSLPSECEYFVDMLKKINLHLRHGTTSLIDSLDLLKDYQLLVDSDIYPEKIHYYKN